MCGGSLRLLCQPRGGLAGLVAEFGADAGEVDLHRRGVAAGDDVFELGEGVFDSGDVVDAVGVEEDFGEQVVVFAHESAGNGEVALEGCSRRILGLHDRAEHECRGEWYGERIGYRFVVFLKGVIDNVKVEVVV